MQHGSSVGLFAYTFLHVWRQFVKEEEEKAMVEKEQESGDREKKSKFNYRAPSFYAVKTRTLGNGEGSALNLKKIICLFPYFWMHPML